MMNKAKPFIVGREAELRLFDDLLRGHTPYCLLNVYGPGGIGKTALAQKLVEHAQVQNVPMAGVDGMQPGLTTERVLFALKEGLARGPMGDRFSHALADFDRQFQDYLVITQVLQRAGGIEAVFDALGKVKDPTGLAMAVGAVGNVVTEGVRHAMQNRFQLQLYQEGAAGCLTKSFLAGLSNELNRTSGPVLFVFDTYEQMEGLDDWVCHELVPGLPDPVRVVILGRNDLHRISFDWSDLGDAAHSMPLPELDGPSVAAYFHHYGLTDSSTLDQIYRFTGGYPLLLVLVRQLAMQAGGWEHVGSLQNTADRDFVATELLERILREERVGEVRAFLEKGVVARWFDPEIIDVLLELGPAAARNIYDSLKHHSFVERHQFGLKFHDKIRELLLERLRFTSEAEYNRLNELLAAYHARKAGIGKSEVPGGA